MTGEKGVIFEKTATQLKKLRLLNSSHTIPTFDEVLKLVDGKVPLLIEIKNQPDKSIVNKTVQKLKHYKGEFAIQSFNPLYINKVKKLAPEMIRGILGTASENTLKGIKYKIVKDLLLNFLIKPQFISYDFKDLPLKKRKVKKLPLLAWTITNNIDYAITKKYCDNIIFENFIPKD
jgi:glycerophosphoryl diester phosphodiesterase